MEPPAEFPSTIYNSDFSRSEDEQSESFPGSEPLSRVVFLLTSSLAFLDASRASAASIALFRIRSAIFG